MKLYKRLVVEAINAGLQESTLEKALIAVISILEDSDLTNAGTGSNLTRVGSLECDASVSLNGKWYGSVSCMKNIRNPIKAAYMVLEKSRFDENRFGLVPPLHIASEEGVLLLSEEMKITFETKNLYTEKKKEKYLQLIKFISTDEEEDLKDTVGAVCLNESTGEVISGVSSGGIWLKYPGRIGEAAVYGSGCWTSVGQTSVGVSVSGTGEQIVRMFASKEIAKILIQDNYSEVSVHKKLHSLFYNDCEDPNVGFIGVTRDRNEEDQGRSCIKFWMGHSTKTMVAGFGSATKKPKAIFSERKDNPVRLFTELF